MANQAIALGARAPQANILGGSIQRNAQMMNMMAQQAAAQRQAEKAQQEMTLSQQTAALTAEEKRRAFRKSDIEYLNNQLPTVKDDVSWNRWLGELRKVDPGLSDDLLRKTGGRYIQDVVDIIGATAEQWINKNFATPVASFQVSDKGVPQSVVVGGLEPSTKEIPQYAYTPDQPAPAATAPSVSADEAAPILQNAAQSKTITPEDADRVRRSLGPNGGAQFDQWMTRNNIQVKPISFEQGGVEPLTMENAPQIVDAALKSGMIDPSHVEQLKQMVGPENGAAIDQWVQQSNLKVQQGLPGMRSAVYRPQAQDFGAPVADDGMAFGGPANALRQDIGYVPTTTRFKSPTEAPLPGSAQVPLPRVRAEAQAQRETPAEAAAKARATKQVEAEVARTAEEQKKLPGKQQVSKIVGKIRDAYEKLEESQAIPSEKRNAFANLFDYAATSAPGREVQKMFGTSTSKYLTEITSSRKLLATAIKNATGMSAQEMNSNTELQLMLDALTDPTQGIEAARSILGTIEELYGAPKPRAAAPTASNKRSGPTPADVKYLRRNYSNPDVRVGFIKHFGEEEFFKATRGQ